MNVKQVFRNAINFVFQHSSRHQNKYLLTNYNKWYLFGSTIVLCVIYKYKMLEPIYSAQSKVEGSKPSSTKLTSREKRFIQFASVEFENQLFMTPQDFLNSLLDGTSTLHNEKIVLEKEQIDQMRKITLKINQENSQLFRGLHTNGIISYTEYLFLLSILTKPESGFEIAFNMLDTDGNGNIDKNEFLMMERIFSSAWKGRQKSDEENDTSQTKNILQSGHVIDTTLLLLFFGIKGNQYLTYGNFKQFMYNLQHEVLEIEFNQFAKDSGTITDIDFVKILLRYAYLKPDQYDIYIERLLANATRKNEPVDFKAFFDFCQFLNSLDDFAISMRMYTLAAHPISKHEFHRAAKICTGRDLSEHLVDIVFTIFDDDGDGLLSYMEFLLIMSDRVHRRFKFYTKTEGWKSFKNCVQQDVRTFT